MDGENENWVWRVPAIVFVTRKMVFESLVVEIIDEYLRIGLTFKTRQIYTIFTTPDGISNGLNHHFCSVGPMLANEIPLTD